MILLDAPCYFLDIPHLVQQKKQQERNLTSGKTETRSVEMIGSCLPFLPQSWKWRMGAWKMTLVSKGAIFHFHDDGRKGI